MTNKNTGIAVLDTEAEQTANRVLALKEQTNWDLPVKNGKPLDGVKLDEWLAKKQHQADINQVERGLGFLLKKHQLGHGQFEAWCKDNGFSPRTVQESIKTARLLVGLSSDKAQSAAKLPHRKLNVLASASPQLIEQMYDDGALDDIDDMDRGDVRELIRLRKANENLEKKLAKAQQQKSGSKRYLDYPLSVERARINTSLLSDKARLCLDDIETIMNDFSTGKDLSRNPEKQQAEFSAGAMAIYLNLRNIYDRAANLIKWFEEAIGEDYLPGPDIAIPIMTNKESTLYKTMRDAMLHEHRAEKTARKNKKGNSG